MKLSPAFTENNIPVVFATGKSYASYLSVAIKSLIDNSSLSHNYDILVMDTGMDTQSKKLLMSLCDKSNISVRIVDVIDVFDKYKHLFYIRADSHMTPTTFIRIFMPELFSQYEKMIYLDCDVIILADIAELYNIDIGENSIGAAPAYGTLCRLKGGDKKRQEFLNKRLNMKNKYINAGVIIFNIQSWIKNNTIESCLKVMQNQKLCDQDIINSVCDGSIYYLDHDWNLFWYIPPSPFISEEDIKNYKKYNPKILHYLTDKKPWNNPGKELAEIWWSYAKKLDFYTDIVDLSFEATQVYMEKMTKKCEREKKCLLLKLRQKIGSFSR